MVFLLSSDDEEQRRAVEHSQHWNVGYVVVPFPLAPGDYSRKMNYGAEYVTSEGTCDFVFLGADDLVFHPGWVERALACHLETGACVVGTNDGGNSAVMRGDHSTHSLVHRDYLDCGTWDEPDSRRLFHEGYGHAFCDTEMVETAMARQTWAHATDCLVEHEHPLWGKALDDATYRRGMETFADDRALFRKRREMWEKEL